MLRHGRLNITRGHSILFGQGADRRAGVLDEKPFLGKGGCDILDGQPDVLSKACDRELLSMRCRRSWRILFPVGLDLVVQSRRRR